MTARWKTIGFGAACVLLVLAYAEVVQIAWGSGHDLLRFSFKWSAALLGFLFLFGLLGWLLWAGLWQPGRLEALVQRVWPGRGRGVAALIVLAFPAWLLLYSPWGDVFNGFFFRLALLLAASAIAAFWLKREAGLPGWELFVLAGLLGGSLFAFAKLFVNVTDYPFSLAWSEGNRLYDYSVLWGRHLYNYPADEPLYAAIDPGRQSLWGLPWLLLEQPPIWLARLWGGLVVSVPYVLLGLLAVRPAADGRRPWLWFGLWTFLFLYQGPIYTPLVLAAVLVALARRSPLWLGFILVTVAGYYAYHSRLSWMIAPALWAAMLELAAGAPHPDRRAWGRALALGTAGVFGSFFLTQVAPPLVGYFGARLRGTAANPGANPAAVVAEQMGEGVTGVLEMSGQIATQQTLLWQRLLPNASFGLGVLLGLLLAALPLIVLLGWTLRRGHWEVGRWPGLAVLAAQAVFLAVGLAASVKVGGGLDLHNLDMFLVGMVLVAALGWEAARPAQWLARLRTSSAARACLLLAIYIPAFVPMVDAHPLALPPEDKTEVALATVQAYVSCAANHGPVLFMDQRQLLTFGAVENVPLIPQYEKKEVMDAALSADAAYFEDFYGDLERARFSLIVTERQALLYKESGASLADENNAWVTWVTEPLLNTYESVADYRLVKVELFMPIGRDYDCSLP